MQAKSEFVYAGVQYQAGSEIPAGSIDGDDLQRMVEMGFVVSTAKEKPVKVEKFEKPAQLEKGKKKGGNK